MTLSETDQTNSKSLLLNPYPILIVEAFSLQQYNISLKRVESEDLEEIRLGRNMPHVRSQLVTDEIISPEMQEKWFQKINSKEHYVFVIIYKQKKIGLLSVKDFVPNIQGSCTASIFIWNTDYLSSRLPLLSIWIAVDFFYMQLGTTSMKTVVKRTNTRAIRLDQFIGFEIMDEGDSEYMSVVSTRASYLQKRAEVIAICKRLCKDETAHHVKVYGVPSITLADEINKILS